MRQTVLSVVLDVEPPSAQRLSGPIEQFKHDQEQGKQSYIRLMEEVPALHFLSMSVFENSQFDPIFVIEANFDGPPGAFLGPDGGGVRHPASADAALLQASRGWRRTGLRRRNQALFALSARALPREEDVRPSVFHQGNRGLDRDRILQEGELFLACGGRWPIQPERNPIPIAASPPRNPSQFAGGAAWPFSLAGEPAPAAFLGRADRRMWRDSWTSSSWSSSACPFPAWRGAVIARPGPVFHSEALAGRPGGCSSCSACGRRWPAWASRPFGRAYVRQAACQEQSDPVRRHGRRPGARTLSSPR